MRPCIYNRRVTSNENWNKVGGQRGQTAPMTDDKMLDATSELEAELSQVTALRGGLGKEITRHQEMTEDQNQSTLQTTSGFTRAETGSR